MMDGPDRVTDEDIKHQRDLVVKGNLSLWQHVIKWAGVAALVLVTVVGAYSYLGQQSTVSCQAKLLQNQAAQNTVREQTTDDFQSLLNKVSDNLGVASAAVRDMADAITAGDETALQQALSKFQLSMATTQLAYGAYIQASELAQQQRLSTPTDFNC